MSKVYITYDENFIVNYIHYMPLHPIHGIAKNESELSLMDGILVDEPTPIEIPEGYATILKYNKELNKVCYELVENGSQAQETMEVRVNNLEVVQVKHGEEILSNMVATTEVFEMVLAMSEPASIDASIKKFKIGGINMALVQVYVALILEGVKTIDQVPVVIRDKVKAELELLTK